MLCATVLVVHSQTVLPRVPPDTIGLAPAALAEATALLRQYVADQKIAGAVAAIARNGSVGYLEAVGMQDLATRAPMTRAIALPHLLDGQAGHRSGGDDAARGGQVPARRSGGEVPARVQRGEGRRGARRGAAAAGSCRSPSKTCCCTPRASAIAPPTSIARWPVRSRATPLPVFVGKITRAPLMEDPHTRFRYSEATTVLGRLVEVGRDSPSTVPAGAPVHAARHDRHGFWVRPEQRDRLATVYGPAPGAGGLAPVEIEAVPFTERPALLEGAVGLVSTVPDYLRFSQMLLEQGRRSTACAC